MRTGQELNNFCPVLYRYIIAQWVNGVNWYFSDLFDTYFLLCGGWAYEAKINRFSTSCLRPFRVALLNGGANF